MHTDIFRKDKGEHWQNKAINPVSVLVVYSMHLSNATDFNFLLKQNN